MKREDLIVYTADLTQSPYGEAEVYFKDDADAVMDSMGAALRDKQRSIDQLISEKYELACKLRVYEKHGPFNKMLKRIKELESIPHTDNTAVIEGLQKRIKELEATISILETAAPKWISVKDRKPEEYGNYLVVHKDCDGDGVIDVFLFTLNKKTRYECWVDDFEEDTSVTHWMPLPPPPTTEET